MTTDQETGLAEQFGIDRAMAALDSEAVIWVLINHQRGIKGCTCGWARLGHSYAAHVLGEIVVVVRAALDHVGVDQSVPE